MSYVPGLGTVVRRTPAALGNAAPHNIFTVTGAVVIKSIYGLVVTTPMDGTASTLLLSHSQGPTDLCAVVAAIANDAVGTLYTITGTLANAMVKRTVATVAVAGGLMTDITVFAGNIYYTNSGAQTGVVLWSIAYVPLYVGSGVVAV